MKQDPSPVSNENHYSGPDRRRGPSAEERALSEAKRRRVLLVDDHAIVREGLIALIDAECDLRVVGDAASVTHGVDLARTLNPDLIVTDISIPGVTGLQGISELRRQCPNARLLVLTVYNREEYIRAALAAGANGYVLKDSTRSDLIRAMRAVLSGERHLCSQSSARIVSSFLGENSGATPIPAGVSGRERQILAMIAQGLSNKRIALSISLSVKTVEKHRANLMRKLQLHNVAEVTRFALQSGLLQSDVKSPTQTTGAHDGHPG